MNYKTALEDYKENVCKYCIGKCDKGIQVSDNGKEIYCYCGEYKKDKSKMSNVYKYEDPIVTKRFEKYIAKKRGEST